MGYGAEMKGTLAIQEYSFLEIHVTWASITAMFNQSL